MAVLVSEVRARSPHILTIILNENGRGANMTKAEKKRRIAELKARKDAIVWKFIGACNEINEQIAALEAAPTDAEPESTFIFADDLKRIGAAMPKKGAADAGAV
jgi:hypothetical protein